MHGCIVKYVVDTIHLCVSSKHISDRILETASDEFDQSLIMEIAEVRHYLLLLSRTRSHTNKHINTKGILQYLHSNTIYLDCLIRVVDCPIILIFTKIFI